MEKLDFAIDDIGPRKVKSPVALSKRKGDYQANYVDDSARIIYDIETTTEAAAGSLPKERLLELAGPREDIYFDPTKVHAAVVTCGGLCPGLNDVIRAIVMCLWYRYGVRRISGIKFGYRGFLPEFALPVKDLTPDDVSDVHSSGGTILGSSRGYGDRITDIVDSLERMGINMFFPIGGDGTQRGALKIAAEIEKRSLKIAVVGIPKTIDNDLSFVQKSFGFETAVSKAVDAVSAAHTEAACAINGIGIVKVMGRQSGFIAAHTALAINDVNFVLVPEVPFDLEGPNGLLSHLENRLRNRNHAVVLIAEGAGADLIPSNGQVDESGNPKLGDIGIFLKDKITDYFRQKKTEINLKYIDPSYIIRATSANSNDSIYCERLGTNAVHAAMAGKTALLVSLISDHFVHIPIKIAVSRKNKIEPDGSLWRDVVEATGQPLLMKN